jgi:hypothetical protein
MTLENILTVDARHGGPADRSAAGAEGQRAGGASEASALGSTQSYCFTTTASSDVAVVRIKRGTVQGP